MQNSWKNPCLLLLFLDISAGKTLQFLVPLVGLNHQKSEAKCMTSSSANANKYQHALSFNVKKQKQGLDSSFIRLKYNNFDIQDMTSKQKSMN